MINQNLTDMLVDELHNITNCEFSRKLTHQAKRCLLDYLGVTTAGARMLSDNGRSHLTELNGALGNVSVIGYGMKRDVVSATLINGLSSHVAELDDGVRFGMVHPGSPVISALFPTAESENVTGNDLIVGIIVGYEAATRIACAIQPSHYNRGYHPTTTCGVIGAATGIAAMLRFPKPSMKNALSAAAVSSSGTLKVLEDGSELKPCNVARAAVDGLLAAWMARVGFEGPDDVLSGKAGFLSMMADEFDLSQLCCSGEVLHAVEKVYIKPYAACRHAHPAIEAALWIKSENNICVEDIDRIKVTTYSGVLGKHDRSEIFGEASAKMSIPFCVSVALATGKAGIEQFTCEYVNNPKITALARKVFVCADDSITKLVPQKRPAIVEVLTRDGACYKKRVDYAKGEPETPLTDKEVEEKFLSLTEYGKKSDEESRDIIEIVGNLEYELPRLFQLL